MAKYDRRDSKTALPQIEKLADRIPSDFGTLKSKSSTDSVDTGANAYTTLVGINLTEGRYIITGYAQFQANTSGRRSICIKRNGTIFTYSRVSQDAVSASGVITLMKTVHIIDVKKGHNDKISVGALQVSGSQLSVTSQIQALKIL